MKRLLITILLISAIFCCADAQYKKIDSLKHLLAKEKNDTTAILLQTQLAHAYLYYKPDSCLVFSKLSLEKSQKLNFPLGEVKSYKEIGAALEQMGNYPGAMNAYLRHLHLAEKLNMQLETVHALTNIGLLYADQNDYRQAVNYTLKAKFDIESIKDKHQIKRYDLNREIILLNAGYNYYKLNLPDSALIYEQNAYQLSIAIHDEDNMDDILLNLGLIQEKYNNNLLALTYFRMGVQKATDIDDNTTLTNCYLRIAAFYKTSGKVDSSIYYAQKAYNIAKTSTFTKGVMDASNLLADIYSLSDKAAAYDYLKAATTAKDTLFDEEKIKQLQNLQFEEKQREQELAEIRVKQAEEQKDHLQLSAIAFFIPFFFVILLVLSKVKIHHRVIESMSILSILFLFEFVTLLLHSYVGDVSKHTPYIEFLAFVSIAAIMIPLHHRVNHWLIKRLTNVHKWGNHAEVIKKTES